MAPHREPSLPCTDLVRENINDFLIFLNVDVLIHHRSREMRYPANHTSLTMIQSESLSLSPSLDPMITIFPELHMRKLAV